MKYDCSNEFDINLIYQKLTSSPASQMVKASQFFERNKQSNLLEQFQQKMSVITLVKK